MMIASPPKLLTPDEIAKLANRTTRMVRYWRARYGFPEPVLHIGKTLRWKEEDVVDWLKANGIDTQTKRRIDVCENESPDLG